MLDKNLKLLYNKWALKQSKINIALWMLIFHQFAPANITTTLIS